MAFPASLRWSAPIAAGDVLRDDSAGAVQVSRLPPGWAAPGPAGLPSGDGAVQELDLVGSEVAAAVFVPLGVDPHA